MKSSITITRITISTQTIFYQRRSRPRPLIPRSSLLNHFLLRIGANQPTPFNFESHSDVRKTT